MRRIVLRWRGHCCRCHALLAPGVDARFDTVTHEVRCLVCKTAARPGRGASFDDYVQVRSYIDDARRALQRAS